MYLIFWKRGIFRGWEEERTTRREMEWEEGVVVGGNVVKGMERYESRKSRGWGRTAMERRCGGIMRWKKKVEDDSMYLRTTPCCK